MRQLFSVLFVVSLAGLSTTACAGGGGPAAPSAPPPSSLAPPPPPPSSKAVLAISGLTVTVGSGDRGSLIFREKFSLIETSGNSGATIQNVASAVEGVITDETSPSCWVQPIRVAPGATLDTFDAGWDDLSYCAPFASGRTTLPTRVTVTVLFTDDEGGIGTVQATTIVSSR